MHIWDEGVVPTAGIWPVMKHSRGATRGVDSMLGCKVKLWKSNLLSQRPIAVIIIETVNQRLYFTKITITLWFFYGGRIEMVICIPYTCMLHK